FLNVLVEKDDGKRKRIIAVERDIVIVAVIEKGFDVPTRGANLLVQLERVFVGNRRIAGSVMKLHRPRQIGQIRVGRERVPEGGVAVRRAILVDEISAPASPAVGPQGAKPATKHFLI